MSIVLDAQNCSVRTLVRVLDEMGFRAKPRLKVSENSQEEDTESDEARYWLQMFIISLVFTLPVFLTAMVLPRFESVKEI